jgi:hypothetical protein
MNPAITLITTNLGVSFETLIVLLYFVGGILFYARDFKIGAMIDFLLGAVIFVWFYLEGYNYAKILIILFIRVIILSFSLYAVAKAENQPLI